MSSAVLSIRKRWSRLWESDQERWQRTRKELGYDVDEHLKPEMSEAEQKVLILGFWEAGIIGTLMVAFFPWSLLFCLFYYGMAETKFLIIALVHDAWTTVRAVIVILLGLIIVIGVAVAAFNR